VPELDLFGDPVVEPPPPPVDDRSAGVRRTARQLEAIRNGQHPLAGMGPLHPDADRSASRDDGPNLPLRCGSCVHRMQGGGPSSRTFPKCDVGPRSHSEATDVRAWWPACNAYQPNPKET